MYVLLYCGVCTGLRLLPPNENPVAVRSSSSNNNNNNNNNNNVFPDKILKDRQITYAPETKFLGVWLDHNLNWSSHVKKIST
jgi:hypothetical protein